MDKASWYKLDNIGKFYAAQAGHSRQTVFRLSADMDAEVDPRVLQRAANRAVELYPMFNVQLRSGFFWHYLEEAKSLPQVESERLPVCFKMHDGRDSVLIRVSWHGRRINLEVSHIISDGRGALELFKALLGFYVMEKHFRSMGELRPIESDIRISEDSFSKNYEKKMSGSTSIPKAARIKGWRDDASPTFMEYHVPADEVHALSKQIGVSVTSLLAAVIVRSVGDVLRKRQRRRSVCMDIPVDLRSLYGSGTLRNFFGLSYVSYPAQSSDDPLEDIARNIQAQLAAAVEPEVLKRRMNRMVKLEKSPFLRVAPLFLKDAAIDLASRVSARDVTTTMSNLGRIKLSDDVAAHVRSINVLTSTAGINFTACSFGDDLSIGISSIYLNFGIQERFCRTFSDMGIRGFININKNAKEVEISLKQAALERALMHVSDDGNDDDVDVSNAAEVELKEEGVA